VIIPSDLSHDPALGYRANVVIAPSTKTFWTVVTEGTEATYIEPEYAVQPDETEMEPFMEGAADAAPYEEIWMPDDEEPMFAAVIWPRKVSPLLNKIESPGLMVDMIEFSLPKDCHGADDDVPAALSLPLAAK